MKLFTTPVLFAALCFTSYTAMAEPKSFTRETVKTGPHGTITHTVNQEATDHGWVRDSSSTNDKGQTASRHTEVNRDPNTGVRTRSVEGTTFKGKSYSSESTRTPTENGYIKETDWKTPNGKTHEKVKVVEKSPGERNVDVTHTNGRGQVSHRTTRTQRQ